MNIRLVCVAVLVLQVVLGGPSFSQTPGDQDWTHFARISGNGLGARNIDAIMKRALEHGTLGIELDNDITGRYDSFLDPTEKLTQIRNAATAAHKIGNHAFVYIAGLECITSHADKSSHSMFKDHPDWVQRDVNGKPAVFTGGASFWVDAGDEDVWISPYAKEWRETYMERVRQIAATGIDGVYIDVAYWMWLYEGWENSWASFDEYTVAAFRERTGLDARKDFTPGDFGNSNFLKWVDFRIQTITEFFKEIDENVKSVNPHCLTIPEVSPSVNDEVVRSGADVYELQRHSDVITHEFFINTNTGAKRSTFDWLTYLLGVRTLRAYDEDHATWLLSYSWDREANTDSIDAMKLLSCAEVMSGANFWDAPRYWMAGSNDYPTRKEIFRWIKENETLLYSPRTSIDPIGVYFSPTTRNYFINDYPKSYYGILHLLLNNHLEYEIITPRRLREFRGNILLLPDTRILNEEEAGLLRQFYERGGKLIITGETGYYDSLRQTKLKNSVLEFLKSMGSAGSNYLFLPECPGKRYFDVHDTLLIKSFNQQLKGFLKGYNPKYKIKAPFNVSVQQSVVNGADFIFITNVNGLKGYSTCIPTSAEGIEIRFESDTPHNISFLPYLGMKQKLTAEVESNAASAGKTMVRVTLPPVQFGGIVVIEN